MRKRVLTSACILIFTSLVSGQQWLYFPTGIPKNWVNIGDLDVPGNSLTVEALITLADLNSVNIVSKHTDPGNVNYLMRPLTFEMTTNVSGFIILNNPVPFCIDSTYHLAATYNGDSVKYYVNGFRVASQSWTGDLVQNDLLTAIGNISVNWANEQFFGYIDEVRIWNVARSRNQIASNMYDLPNPTLQPGLMAYYKFEGNFINLQGNPAYNGIPEGSQLQTTTNPWFTGSVSGFIVQVSITASDTSVCEGTPVEFAATPSNGGSFPFYQWKVNGVHVGNNSPFYTYIPLNNDQVTCTLTSSAACLVGNPATSDPIIMTVGPMLPVSVTIDPDPPGAICSGTRVTFTAIPENGGSSPSYQWKVNATNAGMNNAVFSYIPAHGDQVSCILTSSEQCTTNNPAVSDPVVMTVHPHLPVGISVLASENPCCGGDTVIFTANPVNPGTSPVYQWFIDGNPAGINDSVYTFIPVSGNQVFCMLISSELCATNNLAFSDTTTMVVNPNLSVGVTISASSNPVCESVPVTFTALPENGGNAPDYQWLVNGIKVGSNSPIFSYLPGANDQVLCTLTSSESCTSGNPASSNPVIVTVLEAPEVTFNPCFDTITTTNTKPIKLKGGIPLGGIYSGPGVSNGYFYPFLSGAGNHLIDYTYTNSALCKDSEYRMLDVRLAAPFICGEDFVDVRDSSVYPTVLIWTQCWLAENLNYGIQIPGSQSQRDNCIPEKYCSHDIPELCALSSALYQWDELMRHDDSEGIQGLCPPGWHVPSEADWNALFATFQGNAFAGSPLLFSGFSGFNASLTGVEFFNSTWCFSDFATLFWSSTTHGPLKAWSHGMNNYNHSVSFYPSYRSNAFSVRCIRD